MTSQHPWHALLLAPLPAEQMASALAEDDPQWEYIDSQMVKLGSLAHATLNIEDIQQQLIVLLSEKSKDFRLMVHLLRTLQHGGQADSLMLAVSLLTRYIQHFWSTAWPHNTLHKRRFARQILQRFDSATSSFSQHAVQEQRDTMQGLLAHLAQVWHEEETELAKDVDALRIRYARPPVKPVDVTAPPHPAQTSDTVSGIVAVSHGLVLDHSSDKAWRQTLLKMADMLCEQQPDNGMGFRLRRHAVWGTLTALPSAQGEGRTPLAAVSADRTADYQSRVATADLSLWHQVEQSLTLAPYWLDGHMLSARIAQQLGYDTVALAIRDELSAFLARLPGLRALHFTDMTPFLSPDSVAWLQQEPGSQRGSAPIEQDEIWQCYQQQGLEAALRMTDQQPQPEPRDRFYNQLFSTQLLEHAGLTTLAGQQYYSLLQRGQQLNLSEWEPTLMARLKEKQRQ